MIVYLRNLFGKYYQMEIEEYHSVVDLKEELSKKIGIKSEFFFFVFAGKLLEDHHLLSDYGISRESNIHFLERDIHQLDVIIISYFFFFK